MPRHRCFGAKPDKKTFAADLALALKLFDASPAHDVIAFVADTYISDIPATTAAFRRLLTKPIAPTVR